jgi:hypothetical protein
LFKEKIELRKLLNAELVIFVVRTGRFMFLSGLSSHTLKIYTKVCGVSLKITIFHRFLPIFKHNGDVLLKKCYCAFVGTNIVFI